MSLFRPMVLIVLAVLISAPAASQAQQPPPDAKQEYVPVDRAADQEQLPAAPLVIGAYAFIWAAALAYLWIIWRRLAAVDQELLALRRAIERRQ
jgi:hypothetical protein